MSDRYTRAMIAITRIATAAVLLACLAACGNKGPLVHPSQPQAEGVPAPATSVAVPMPPATDPTDVLPPADSTPPPDAGPAGAVPPASPPAGGGNG
jgi:predicted small lipoprotein YifL